MIMIVLVIWLTIPTLVSHICPTNKNCGTTHDNLNSILSLLFSSEINVILVSKLQKSLLEKVQNLGRTTFLADFEKYHLASVHPRYPHINGKAPLFVSNL